jgi:hypothetical protein
MEAASSGFAKFRSRFSKTYAEIFWAVLEVYIVLSIYSDKLTDLI